MDKINIVSPQAVLKMSSFSMDTCSMSSSPLINSLVKNRLFKTAPDIDEPPFQFIHTMDLSVIDTMLHDTRNPQDWDLGCLEGTGWTQESLPFLDAVVCSTVARARRRCAGALSSRPIREKKSLPDTLHIAGSSMTSLWRREAASNQLVRDITRISCFVTTMKLPHALQIYSTVFVKKRMRIFSR